jgi:hypothetical protein
MPTIRDRLWIWGHEAGAHNGNYGLPAPSRMTPMEAAVYLNVPNALMIAIGDQPAPPFDRHMIAFRPLKRVVWSIVGDSSSARNDLDEVLGLAARYPNLIGAIMDDFFHAPDADGNISRVGLDELSTYRGLLNTAARPLDLFTAVYAHDLDLPIRDYVELCDVVTFWHWRADELPRLEDNFQRLEKVAFDKRILLGCYLWDFGACRPMPLELMQHQCQLGRRLLREGRIEGLIFLASCTCDLELDTVAWVRDWVAEVGGKSIR